MIDRSKLRQLCHYVERNLAECDGTHRLTVQFAARRGLDASELLDVVKSLGSVPAMLVMTLTLVVWLFVGYSF